MQFDKFTIKSQELIQNSQTLASRYSHQQFEPEHLLAAMLKEVSQPQFSRVFFTGSGVFKPVIFCKSAAIGWMV